MKSFTELPTTMPNQYYNLIESYYHRYEKYMYIGM